MRDELGGRCGGGGGGGGGHELQPSAMHNHDNPGSGIHPGAVTY